MQASNPLDIRTCTKQVQEALLQVIDLAYRHRYPAAANLAALQAYAALNLPDRALVYVESEGVVYRWHTASLLTPAPPFVVQPLELPEQGNGRWIRESSSVTLGPAHFRLLHRIPTGYARTVQIYQGEDDEVLERIYGQRPAFLVEWVSDQLEVKSYLHGAIYDVELRFLVHAVARNLRNGPQAVLGSDVATDTEPGLLRMIGDLRYLLGGCTLGLEPGVKFADVTGAARIVEMDLAQRLFRAELDVTVKASVHVMDEDLIPNFEVWVERRDAGTPRGESFDPSNYVALGYRFAPRAGLTAAPAAGVAYLHGQLVQSAPGPHSFLPNADTYRDLYPSGVLLYQAVAIGADPPLQPPGTLRLGFTRTDDSRIVADTLTCSFAVPSGADPGDPFRAV
jgi:phage gp37-like protein